MVALDDALCDTIDEAGAPGRRGNGSSRSRRLGTPRAESALSPRDIQMRLRAGRSISHVANEAGVDEDWVMRFAAPILAEQALVVAKALQLTFSKARLGVSGKPLGESVWWNVADKGALMSEDTFDQCWTALHLRDRVGLRFDFVNRKKRQRAEWEVDVREGTIASRNRLASELGYVEPAVAASRRCRCRRRQSRWTGRPVPEVGVQGPAKVAAKRAAAKKSTARRPAKKTPAKKTAAKKTGARQRPQFAGAARRRPAAKNDLRPKGAGRSGPR